MAQYQHTDNGPLSNIFQVKVESDLDEILREHSQSLTIVMYSSKTCPPCMNFKPVFMTAAKDNPDCFFVYVDVNGFQESEHKYLKDVKTTPKFSYYFVGQIMAQVHVADINTFFQTMMFLKYKIKEREDNIQRAAVQQQQQQQQQQQHTQPYSSTTPDNSNAIKLDLVHKLYNLTQQGVVLTQSYSMDSDIEQMKLEYNLHTRARENQIKQTVPSNVPVQIQATPPPPPPPTPTPVSANEQNLGVTSVASVDSVQVPTAQVVIPQVQVPQVVIPQVLIPQIQSKAADTQQNQISQQMIDQNDLMRKHEQLKKIQELNQIQAMIQRQQLFKLNRLKEFQQARDKEERSRKSD